MLLFTQQQQNSKTSFQTRNVRKNVAKKFIITIIIIIVVVERCRLKQSMLEAKQRCFTAFQPPYFCQVITKQSFKKLDPNIAVWTRAETLKFCCHCPTLKRLSSKLQTRPVTALVLTWQKFVIG